MKVESAARRRARACLALLGGLALVALRASSSAAGVIPVLDCASFGSQCEATLAEGEQHESTIAVPAEFCDTVAEVRVSLALRHPWIGDLSIALRNESSQIEVVLADRPGSPLPTHYGCPGEDIDASFDDSAASRGEDTCAPTVPAIAGTAQSALYARRLILEPAEATFDIGDCPFERFEGDFVPAGGAPDRGCPPFLAGDFATGALCDFRGRWNDGCGDGDLVIRLERLNGGRLRANILGQEEPYHFDASVRSAFAADLELFGSIAEREIGGTLETRATGLAAFRDLPCAGDWTLRVVDLAVPHHGRLLGWSLDLIGAAAPTQTPTVSPSTTPTGTATETTTATVIDTATVTPSASASVAIPTDTPTQALTETPSEATPTASNTPTASATPSATASSAPTDTATPSQTGDPTITPSDDPTATPPDEEATATPDAATPTPPQSCGGDCDGDGGVDIGELIRGVRIALRLAALDACSSFDTDGDGAVSIGELIRAVRNALEGC